MPDVMIDLETFDLKPSAVIVQIAAVAFDPHGILDEGECFDSRLFIDSQLEQGRTISQNTLGWWFEKGLPFVEGVHRADLGNVLLSLTRWVEDQISHPESRKYIGKVWFWGMGLDPAVLRHAYETHPKHRGFVPEWIQNGLHQRDARTLCSVVGVERSGDVKHEAVMDCTQQIKAVQRAHAMIPTQPS